MRLRLVLTLLSLAIPFTTAAAAAAGAPLVGIQNISQLDVPDRPFSDSADANADVEKAFALARSQNKRVLIDLGANWCADCRILQALMDRPEVREFLAANYVVVVVDVGRLNRNLQIPARFGIADKLEGLPAVLIADPDGKLINAGHFFALDEARHMTPQDIVDWMAHWTR